MRILYLLIPMALGVVGVALWAFLWAVRTGQFDDLEGPAHRILMDDDDPFFLAVLDRLEVAHFPFVYDISFIGAMRIDTAEHVHQR